jgi:hypothetical protein
MVTTGSLSVLTCYGIYRHRNGFKTFDSAGESSMRFALYSRRGGNICACLPLLSAKCPVSKIAFLSGESLLPMFALNLVCVVIPLGWSYQPIAIQLYVWLPFRCDSIVCVAYVWLMKQDPADSHHLTGNLCARSTYCSHIVRLCPHPTVTGQRPSIARVPADDTGENACATFCRPSRSGSSPRLHQTRISRRIQRVAWWTITTGRPLWQSQV